MTYDDIAPQLKRLANIPPRYAINRQEECSKHNGWDKAFKELRLLVSSRHNGRVVVICGTRGTGKTQMACEIVRLALAHLFFCRYDVFQDYLDHVRKVDSLDEHHEFYILPRILVLDEIAKAGDSAWAENRLFHLVNHRYNALKHTILITAARPEGLSHILGPSVGDRVTEGGAVLHLDWPSFRPTAQNQQ